MSVTLAKSAGFCFGVKRAVRMAEQASECETVWALGEIIHNRHEIERLCARGVRTACNIDEIPEGATVLVRAHGEARIVHKKLAEKGCRVLDATCPFVRKIHAIVEKESARGAKIIVVGSINHPEVLGIQGWCEKSLVAEDEHALALILENELFTHDEPICVVAQTTLNRKIWNISVEFLKKQYTNCEIFDTICNATDERQAEARLLAEKSDTMIVIGDRKSSNTTRLYEISKSLCARVFSIEDISQLQITYAERATLGHIGITAGASTPARIIKEVSNMMSEQTTFEKGEDFAAMLEESFKTLNTGDKVTGTIIQITSTDVQVDLGVKHAAYVPLSELSDDPSYRVEDHYKAGDEIETVVQRVNDGEGTITLSKKRVDQLKGWETIEQAKDDHEIVEGTIIEENRGGVVATANGVRVFIPASQTGVPKDQPMSQLLKTKQNFYITEINRQRKRVVGSIRAVAQESRRLIADKVWETIDVAQEFTGVVKSLTSYGAFVDIGGVDGMIHISELSWGRIKHPSEIVSIGDEVRVYIIGLDKENKKISLGYKRDEDNPWSLFKTKFRIDDITTVKILKFMPFGAFAEIIPGVDGLIHISQISNRHVAKPDEALTVGQEIDAMIIDINDEKQKVSLSIRATLDDDGDED